MKKRDYLLLLFLCILAITGIILHLKLNFSEKSVMTAAVQDSRDQINLPVLMYHGITDNPDLVNEYLISDSMLEDDLLWLKDNGYTTISAAQLVAYVENGAKLPEKPVLLTFDDGYCNNYTLAFPLLQKYNAKAIISVIGSESDISSSTIYRDCSHSNLTWGEAAIMAGTGLVEIGNHTYDLHSNTGARKGADKKAGESQEAYRKILSEDLLTNQQRIREATGRNALVFAWPLGAYPSDGSANPILKDLGFKISLTSYQIMNTIEKGNPDSLFGLKRFLRTPEFSMEKLRVDNSATVLIE